MQPAFFKSEFAILDVKDGRHELERKINLRGGSVHVLVEMMIDRVHSRDDGTSREFSCSVTSVKEYVR